MALARAGLLSAAWAAWALEEPHDASWTKRGELLLLAGATPSAPELEALDLDPSTSSEWLVFLAARDMLSPRDVKHFPGRAAQHWDYVCAAQRLHFAPSDLRLSFVSLDPAPRIARIANQLERDAQTLLAMARRARFEFEVDAPAQAALLDLLIMPLAEIAIYRARRLDDDPRIPFDRSYRVETVLEVRESLPPGSGRDALEVAAIALPKIRGFERDRGITERRPHARAFVRAMQPLCFERLNRLSVQIRVWCMWWLLECRKFGVELPHADLEHEIRLLFADMDSVTWQTPSLDGRRYLEEDEVYLHGATFLLCATYPREPTEPWPDFTDLLEFAKRTIHTQAHTSDLLAIGTIVLAQGDVEAAEDLLADLDPGAEHSRQSLLRAACFLQRARWSGDAKAREALLTRAEAKLTSLKLDDWDRPYWAAWIDLLLQRGADPATQTEAEARWTGAEPGALGPVPYLLFDPERLHFLPDRGGGPLPFPPPR
ncbi:MAG: hypothetical protein KDD82_23605 [Planctomycetes bacterium]|nr:hypothetical protein [Planctomycetota bacterium]